MTTEDRVPCPLCGGSGCFDCADDGTVRGPDAPILDPSDHPCAFGPDGDHCDVVAVCDACLKPTCDFCGYGHNDEEEDWLCPDHAPAGKAGT